MSELQIIKQKDAEGFKRGLRMLFSLTDEKIQEIYELRKKMTLAKSSSNYVLAQKVAAEISANTGLNKKDALDFLGLFISLTRFTEIEKAKKIEADLGTLGFKDPEIERIKKLLTTFKKDGFDKEVKKEDGISASADNILPFLAGFSYECDVRYCFEGKKVASKFPIALVRLDLNTQDNAPREYVRFQTRAEILKLLIRDLRETYNKLVSLEKA